MKTHRWIIFVSIILCVLSFVSALLFYNPIPTKGPYYSGFINTLSLSVFASGLVVFLTSLLSCNVEKGKAISALVARIVKVQSKFENAHMRILEKRDSTSEAKDSKIEDKVLVESIDKLRVALLWTPRNERISWHHSTVTPPNQVLSTQLQRAEFNFITNCSMLIELCNDYWNCYRNLKTAAPVTPDSSTVDTISSTGCRSALIKFFLNENTFMHDCDVYLGLLNGKDKK